MKKKWAKENIVYSLCGTVVESLNKEVGQYILLMIN